MATDLEQRFPGMSGCCKECQDIHDLKKRNAMSLHKALFDRDLVLLNSSRKGNLGCVNVCLEAGANVNFQAKEGFYTVVSPLSCALDSGHDECVEALIKAGAEVTEEDLRTGAMKGNERCVNLILEAKGDATCMLFYAACWGRANIVDLLIKAGADVNKHGILKRSLDSRSARCVKSILAAGVDLDVKNSCLRRVIDWDSQKYADMLLEAGADVNISDDSDKTLLFYAVMGGYPNRVEYLLKKGADVNKKYDSGQNLLFLAVNRHMINFFVDNIKILLREGIKVNVKNIYGLNPLTHKLVYHLQNASAKEYELALLLFAAGETIDKTKVRKVPDYLKAIFRDESKNRLPNNHPGTSPAVH